MPGRRMPPAGEDQETPSWRPTAILLTGGRASAICLLGLLVSSVYWLACLPGLLGLPGLPGPPAVFVAMLSLLKYCLPQY